MAGNIDQREGDETAYLLQSPANRKRLLKAIENVTQNRYLVAVQQEEYAWKEQLREESMMRKRRTKLIHEGQYAAEVDVELIESEAGWGPYLSVEDAQKLDTVREALRQGDLKRASQLARIFKLTPVAG